MLWVLFGVGIIVLLIALYAVAMSTEAGSWLRTRRELLGRDRLNGRR